VHERLKREDGWLPYCGQHSRAPLGTGWRKVEISYRDGRIEWEWGHVADWRGARLWRYRRE
jgi:hypothetical protein